MGFEPGSLEPPLLLLICHFLNLGIDVACRNGNEERIHHTTSHSSENFNLLFSNIVRPLLCHPHPQSWTSLFVHDLNRVSLQPWGILYAFRQGWQSVELYADVISVGRSNANTHTISEQVSESTIISTYSG